MAQKRSTAVGRVLRERVCDYREFGAQFFKRGGGRMLNAECRAHRGGNAYGRRAADDHVLDGARDVAVVGVGVVDDFARQAQLVENDDALRLPFDRFDVMQGMMLRSRARWCAI